MQSLQQPIISGFQYDSNALLVATQQHAKEIKIFNKQVM
jgi:hypothetical protein